MTQVRAEKGQSPGQPTSSPLALIGSISDHAAHVMFPAPRLYSAASNLRSRQLRRATIPQREAWRVTSSAPTHKIATSFDRIDTAMTNDSKSKETTGTDETLNRMAAWRGSLDELGKSIGGLRQKCAQLPQESPQQITNCETEITQSLGPHPISPTEPQSPEPADPVLQEIKKLEHEAFILRRIFGDRRLSANELKILTEVDAELAALRVE